VANDDDDEWTVARILTADPAAPVDDLHAADPPAVDAVAPAAAAVDAAPPVAPEHDIHGDGVDDEKIYYYWDDDFHSRLQSDIHRD